MTKRLSISLDSLKKCKGSGGKKRLESSPRTLATTDRLKDSQRTTALHVSHPHALVWLE